MCLVLVTADTAAVLCFVTAILGWKTEKFQLKTLPLTGIYSLDKAACL